MPLYQWNIIEFWKQRNIFMCIIKTLRLKLYNQRVGVWQETILQLDKKSLQISISTKTFICNLNHHDVS